MAAITHQVWIKASANKVYDAVTGQEGLSQWWIRKTTARPELGYINLFDEGASGVTPMKIIELTPNEFVEWQCLLPEDEWTNTRISFDIQQKKGAVILNFSHSCWRQQSEYFSVCNFHWARHLLTLKSYCETGKGQLDVTLKDNWKELTQAITQ
ncbi:hypothetical protein GCM10023149_42800 [Mucilaginibacter gynuensis]|uniref:Activator of Hsp90 ATPase homologue 1/2-like C-terminal domain-containing protein n=2 Tax=Mucilaginibacter gynuensis TaxID=1302236 RepID=A0ABP8H6L7_9SPHI